MSINLNEKNIIKYECDGSSAQFITNSECIVKITAVSCNTLEIWADFDGNGLRGKSYSIDRIPQGASISVTEKELYYFITSGSASVRLYKNNVKITYVSSDDKEIICEGKSISKNNDGSLYMSNKIGENEHFYGLGEDNDGYLGCLDRRGHTRDMITGQRIHIGHVTADIPVTFYIGTGAKNKTPYGIFTDNSYPMYYDMGKENHDECFQKAVGGDMIFYYFCGESFGDILNEYTSLTGKPPMPPLWTLGYTQCRCSYYSWEQIDEIIENLRDKKIPLDCIVFDFDWAEYFNNYKWNKRWNGMSPKKIKEYRKQGLHFMASCSGPMLKKDSDTYESAVNAGVLAHSDDGNTIQCGHYGGELIDFSNPATKEWLRPQLERILDDGVESWWLDLTEPEGDPENTVYFDGERNKVHNVFSQLCTKTYAEISSEHCPEMRPFILTRTGTAGIQKYCTAIWSGDVFSDYKTFTAHIPEAINSAMSGIYLWTSDSGGFMSSSSNAADNRNIYKNDIARHGRLFERWLQFSCFCPIMRVHHAGESAPYAFGALAEDGAAHYIRLRYRLLPYIYSYMYKSHTAGEPIMRPLVYNYFDDENVYDITDEFLFGDEILVAPVHEENVSERSVYFPKGFWYDMDYGYKYEGGKSCMIYAPQNRIPVFIRAGAVIPTSEQIYNTSELDRSALSAEIYPYEKSEFTVYSDDGITRNYEQGIFTLTQISCAEEVGYCTKINISSNNSHFAPNKARLKIHVNAVPNAVAVNGVSINRCGHLKQLEGGNIWFYDDFSRVLYIASDIKAADNEIVICYNENSLIIKPFDGEENIAENGQSPFIFPAASVPCKIGFENFDRGGEGVAYHKNSPDNEDGIYRNEAVGIESCSDIGNGHSVRNIETGEWLEYTINILTDGEYFFKLRVSADQNSSVSIFSDDTEIVNSLDISGEKWHDNISKSVFFNAGEHIIRFYSVSGRFDGNYFEILNIN